MNKQQILQLTGLSEDQFYDQYPDQETFCNDYPEACSQLEQAQGGMQVGITYDKSGNPVYISPDVVPSDWQVIDGMYTRPHTVDRFGNPIGPMTSVIRQTVDKIPFNRAQPMDVITPMIARYTLPKGMVDNSKPIEKMTIPVERMSAEQTMRNVGSTNSPYIASTNKYESIVDLLKAKGMDASLASRKKLAEENNIKNYTGSSVQNKQLIDIINNLNSGTSANSINQNYNYLAPPQKKAVNLNKFIPVKQPPTISDYTADYISKLKNKVPVDASINIPTAIPTNNENRHLESGMIEDKNKGVMYAIKNGKVIKTFPIMTGQNKNANKATASLEYLEKHPEARATPVGNYLSVPKKIYGKPGFSMNPISAFGEPAPQAKDIAQHILYGTAPKGTDGYDPKEGARRTRIMQGPGENRVGSYGCTNMFGQDIDCLTGQLFPKGDTTIVVDSRIPKDNQFIQSFYREMGGDIMTPDYDEMKYGGIHIKKANRGKFTEWAKAHHMGVQEAASHVMANKEDYSPTIVKRANFAKNAAGWKHEEGGTAIFPAMRNFKKGGYYGMDQKFHPNSDSGTYVSGAGYYFQPGGTAVTSSTPPGQGAGVDVSNVPGAGGLNPDGSFAGDQFSDVGNFDNSSDPFGVQDQSYGREGYQANPYEESNDQQAPYDASQYSSEIDPATGFTRYKKNDLVLKNIKKQDPALWQHLKEEGHGARWQTGQTDIQKVGRVAGAIGRGLGNAIDAAGMIGGYLNSRQQQRNMDKAAMNMGSTASMFTNPQGSGKGDYGVTGSGYGMFKPNQTSNFSFKGMYGKYGMEVPTYQTGGGFSNLFANAALTMPIANPIEFRNSSSMVNDVPISDNTRVAPPTVPLDIREQINNSNVKISNIPNPKGKDIATRLNNPGNIIYTPIFGKMFGAVDSGIKQADGSGHFAAFPDVQTGLKARETQLFGNVDGIFQSRYYKPNTDIDSALKKWSGGGYGVNIYPALKGKTLAEITPQERKELMKRQIKQESGSMYRYLQSIGTFKDGGQQNGGQVVEMDENQIQQFLAAGGQLEFID